MGNVVGTTYMHKFGIAPDYDQADGFVTVWDGAEDDVVWENMVYTYSSSADIDFIVSENDGDTQDVEVHGLDTNWDLVVQTITLTGQTPSALTTDLIRVFRMINVGSSNNAGHIFCYKSGGTVTAGVPQTATDIRAIIQPGNNQTLMSIYTIPNGKRGYITNFYASTHGAGKTATFDLHFLVRPLGQVFQLKHTSSSFETGTSHWIHRYDVPELVLGKSDIEIRTNTLGSVITGATMSTGFELIIVDD